MKYTISDENRWTTLAACVEHHVFYEYWTSWYFYNGRLRSRCFDYDHATFSASGDYPTEVAVKLSVSDWKSISGHLYVDAVLREQNQVFPGVMRKELTTVEDWLFKMSDEIIRQIENKK